MTTEQSARFLHLKIAALLLLAVPLLAGCNTVAGIGEDLEAAGEAVEEKAEEKKRY